ncbi:sugar ABC transporter ATP-binding protein [Mesorhizobium sp. BAC0120]|uniref:sugar ABC transporter ATP-binding protein n=1 Tax=Mesorhizobium sp. BAC0120 TaxID=3090670 RepID=UPI00298C5A31|nr:sugar ABC transporter ATP-binding protein [Mesorhizobium sp. BAC0120]MDW6023435.1 sugar ABC transporter ATP-binding protein [Mesorhizobium sp. BAC0120]
MTAVSARQSGEDPFILKVENLGKRYGPTTALRNVSLGIRRGTIHGLLGENGAGKSTLVGLISGQREPSTGTIYLDGRPIEKFDVKAMEKAGVFLVTQEPMIVDHITAAENLMLGIWPSKGGFVSWRRLKAEAARMLDGSGIDPQAMAGKLDAVARRKLNILRAMFSGGKVIILDEPTAALTVEDRVQLFAFMRELKAQGVTFIFISHYNDEILHICDACSVLRDGALAGGTEDVASLTSEQLSELVLGRGLVLFQHARRTFDGEEPAVRLRDVVSDRLNVRELDLRPGEIVGFTGLPGAGAKELARTIFGLASVRSGTIAFGKDSPRPLPATPRDAFDLGVAFLSDDRRRDGLVAQMTIGANISLSSLSAVARAGFLRPEAERVLSERYFRAMGIKAAGPSTVVDTLSGGNQQKVCLGRVLATEPRLLILDEPTRGIDIGVKQDVLRIIDELSRSGVTVIIVSTDIDEIVRAVDRVCVFENGEIREELAGEAISSERLRQESIEKADV